ncbi:hypothetical protein TNCV_2455421 [Trichonephila clavipes]|nr:hypothetical protein TNCV_2455421 [Trichonephila clavipes]
MEPEEESDIVTEYMFQLINRLKRCQEVAINKMEEMQIKQKTSYYDNGKLKDASLVITDGAQRIPESQILEVPNFVNSIGCDFEDVTQVSEISNSLDDSSRTVA